MSKNTVIVNKQSERVSLCDVMKNDTSEVIQKLESHIPSFAQNYSDLYSAYLHMFNDVFGTCYIVENEFFDKLNIPQGILKEIKKNSETIKQNYLDHIDMSVKFFDEYVKMRVLAIDFFDNYFHSMIDSYAKMISQFNESIKQSA